MLPGLRTPFGNFTQAGRVGNPFAIGAFVMSQFDPSLTWADVDWLRGLWSGPLVLKGIMSPEAARHAVDQRHELVHHRACKNEDGVIDLAGDYAGCG